MFKLLITTFNCGVPTNSVIENFETMQQLQNAQRSLDRANERFRRQNDWARHDLYQYVELH